MKNLKAIKILNKILKEINDDSLFLSEDFIPNLEIQKAIVELEELENIYKCDGCNYYRTPNNDFPFCVNYEKDLNFSCDRLKINDNYEK